MGQAPYRGNNLLVIVFGIFSPGDMPEPNRFLNRYASIAGESGNLFTEDNVGPADWVADEVDGAEKIPGAGKYSALLKLSRVVYFELERGSLLQPIIPIILQQPLDPFNGSEVFKDKIGHQHQPTRGGNQ